MGEMSPFLLFDGDDDAKMDKRGPHSGKTDVAKKVRFCGSTPSSTLGLCRAREARPAPDQHVPLTGMCRHVSASTPSYVLVLHQGSALSAEQSHQLCV